LAVSAKRFVSYSAYFVGHSLPLAATPALASIHKVIHDNNSGPGGRYLIEGVESLQRNTKVRTAVLADCFFELFVSRIQGKYPR
jgi:hypothetical protein